LKKWDQPGGAGISGTFEPSARWRIGLPFAELAGAAPSGMMSSHLFSKEGAMMARRYHRFKDSFTGSIQYLGSSHPCLVEEISQRGLYLLSGAAVNIGDRMSVDLRISQDARFSCVIEIRQVTSDGLGAEIVDIADADVGVLSGRIEEHYSAVRLAKAARAGKI
jgi:hypothetical protein